MENNKMILGTDPDAIFRSTWTGQRISLEDAFRIISALRGDEREKLAASLERDIDSVIRWMQSIHEQKLAEKESISEALSLREDIALFLRRHPIPHVPGARLRDIIIPALERERKVCSGPLLLRLWNAVVLALKGDPA